MEKVYLIGAGNIGRNIIGLLPYGMVQGVMDSDKNKIGQIYESFVIEPIDYMVFLNNKVSVVFSFYDKAMIGEFEKLGIRWYVAWGNERNIFYKKEISTLLIQNLVNKYYWDKRLKQDINISIDKTLDLYRSEYCSNFNQMLVELMRSGNIELISQKLNEFYNQLEDSVGLLDDECFEYRVGFQLAEKIILDACSSKKKYRLLDVACGHGEFLSKMIKNGIYAEGVDISRRRVKYLNKTGISAYVGTAEDTGMCDAAYDYCTCFECLEHVMNPILVINEINRILNSTGKLIISVPYKRRCDYDTHVRIFDENNMASLLAEHFEIENMILIPYLLGSGYNNLFLVANKKG